MGKGKRYTQEYKKIIVDLYKSGMGLEKLSNEYGIVRLTIAGQVKDPREIKINENETITMKEFKELKKQMARIQEDNKVLHQRRVDPKKLWPYLQHKNRCFNSSH